MSGKNDPSDEFFAAVGTDVPPESKLCKREGCPVMEAAKRLLFMNIEYAKSQGFIVVDENHLQYYCKRCKEWKWIEFNNGLATYPT